jgi:hypothetical protein
LFSARRQRERSGYNHIPYGTSKALSISPRFASRIAWPLVSSDGIDGRDEVYILHLILLQVSLRNSIHFDLQEEYFRYLAVEFQSSRSRFAVVEAHRTLTLC